jgi:hypothetical protein
MRLSPWFVSASGAAEGQRFSIVWRKRRIEAWFGSAASGSPQKRFSLQGP